MSNSSTSFLHFRYNTFRKSLSKSSPPSFNLSKETKQTPNISLANFRPKIEEMKRVFDKFDKNKDGKISQEEYKSAMKIMMGNTKSYEVADAFHAADTDGDGFINFEEFMRVQNLEGGVNTTDIRSAFKAFDSDGDGKISVEELLRVQRKLGEKCSLESCKKMVRGVDANGDGFIDMDEFMTMMTRTTKLV